MALNAKQQAFLNAYLASEDLETRGNATRSALAAGYSPKSAYCQGSRMLKNAEVKAEIEHRLKKATEKAGLTQEKVLAELAKIAFFDPRKLFDEDGNLKPISELDDETAGAIAGVDVIENFEFENKERRLTGYTKKLKISDKNTAIQAAMKHLGIAGADKAEMKFDLSGCTEEELDVLERILAKTAKPSGD